MSNKITAWLISFVLWITVLDITHGAVPSFTSPATNSSTLTVAESVATGTVVLSLAATDADGGVITFTIGWQSPASPTKFGVTGSNVVTTNTFDYEVATDRQYELEIVATTDAAGTDSASSTVTITVNNVNDNPPSFSSNIYYASIAENTAAGTSVKLLTVNDADGDTMTISITAGDEANKFGTNLKQIVTSSNIIDYETLSAVNFQYTLEVEASDGGLTSTATVIISITGENEAAPVFETTGFSPVFTSSTTPYNIEEDSTTGTTIVTVTASDTDLGVAGQITYSLGTITKSSGVTASGIFHIDKVSGLITTASNSFDRDPVTGGLEYYDVTVIASDQGPSVRSATVAIRVGLTDVNDNSPEFDKNVYYVSISETDTAGTSVLTLTATDKDATTTSFRFTIDAASSPTSYSTKFELDAVTQNQINLKSISCIYVL
ncbi:STAN-like protein, partial [Mya arenaria]